MIRSLLMTGALMLASCSNVFAAPPVFSWTGFYVGVNAGLSSGDNFQTPGEYG